MTPKEFKDEMKSLAEEFRNDKEARHSNMDGLMCKLLKKLGYKKGVEVFEEVEKHYS